MARSTLTPLSASGLDTHWNMLTSLVSNSGRTISLRKVVWASCLKSLRLMTSTYKSVVFAHLDSGQAGTSLRCIP